MNLAVWIREIFFCYSWFLVLKRYRLLVLKYNDVYHQLTFIVWISLTRHRCVRTRSRNILGAYYCLPFTFLFRNTIRLYFIKFLHSIYRHSLNYWVRDTILLQLWTVTEAKLPEGLHGRQGEAHWRLWRRSPTKCPVVIPNHLFYNLWIEIWIIEILFRNKENRFLNLYLNFLKNSLEWVICIPLSMRN